MSYRNRLPSDLQNLPNLTFGVWMVCFLYVFFGSKYIPSQEVMSRDYELGPAKILVTVGKKIITTFL